MNSRQRVIDVIEFRNPDTVPLQYHPSLRGYYEYGERMRELFNRYPYDFYGNITDQPIPVPPKDSINSKGEYYEQKYDEYNVLWEYRIFCIQGHPLKRPLDDIEALPNFKLPPNRKVNKINTEKFYMDGWINIFERMVSLRKFEDVLMDIYYDTPEINKLADMLTEYNLKEIDSIIESGADALQFGDDFGTQHDLIISPEVFRSFFKPRYKVLIDKVKKAGKKVHFHSCGANMKLLEDFKDLGIDSIWPQLTAYDTKELAQKLREYKIACALHFRGHIMNNGTPEDVKRWVDTTSEAFDVKNGGSWFYIEIDDGFPYENTEALFEAVDRNRR